MNTTPTTITETTTWTVGDHTLTRTDTDPAYWRTDRLNNDAVQVSEDPSDWRDENATITYSVNWSAQGDRTPEEAIEYAARIVAAANAAQVFTTIRAENK